MLTEQFIEAKEIIETIESFHHEAYFVGGAVRDLMLGIDVNDVDIATSATPEQVMNMFKKVIPVGIEHGTVLVRYNGVSYEVTTFRSETGTDELNDENRSIEQDLHCRDFTMNAIAMDKDGNIIDLFNGKQHISDKVIRSVGCAKDRFTEDPLRIIRALRFASQFGFSIEKDTLKWMKRLKQSISGLAVERIKAEMNQFFAGEFVNECIEILKQTDIYKYLPIFKDDVSLINQLPQPLIPLKSFAEIISLCHIINSNISVSKWVKRWKCSNAIKKEAEQFVQALYYYDQIGADVLLVYRLDRQHLARFRTLATMLFPHKPIEQQTLEQLYDQLPIKSRKDINFNGRDLMRLYPNKQQGRWISETIEKIETEIIFNKLVNDKDMIEEWVLCGRPEVN